MAAAANKIALVDFLFKEWQLPEYARLLNGKCVFVCHGSNCSRFTTNDAVTVTEQLIPGLSCSAEEVDTRMFLHVNHAANTGASRIVIRSPDSDVLVIGCSVAHQIPAEIILQTGTKNQRRCISMTAIACSLGEDVCKALPGLHAFPGCDSTSAFFDQGKSTAFELVKNGTWHAMQELGCQTTELLRLCEEFTSKMYSKKVFANGVNDLRYKLWVQNPSNDSMLLPPTIDALSHHVNRTNYQALLWRNAMIADYQAPTPNGCGWEVKNSLLNIVWMTNPPAPAALLQLTRCSCAKGCETRRCSFVKSSFPCTAACTCVDCKNDKPINKAREDDGDGDECEATCRRTMNSSSDSE